MNQTVIRLCIFFLFFLSVFFVNAQTRVVQNKDIKVKSINSNKLKLSNGKKIDFKTPNLKILTPDFISTSIKTSPSKTIPPKKEKAVKKPRLSKYSYSRKRSDD